MKFIHIADLHLDCIFSNLSDKDNLGEKRRLEQRKILRKIIDYIKENKIDMLLIAGDFYEEKYITKSSIEYINNLFMEIQKTRIYISPGNHDPYLANSYYATYEWSSNVKIFRNEVEKIEDENVNIFGYGFADFYDNGECIQNFRINEEDKEKVNILVTHADLEGFGQEYNPIGKNKLDQKGFSYVALGHIHKTNFGMENKIVYPGSTVSLGFDEVGNHGMVVGEIIEGRIDINFIELDENKFCDEEINVSNIIYFEDLIEKINLITENNKYIRIILIGNRNFEINKNKIYTLIDNPKIIKIKDETSVEINLDELESDVTLKGIFIKMMKEKLDSELVDENKKIQLEKILGIGLEALK